MWFSPVLPCRRTAMQGLFVAFQASGDYMLYIINGSGLKYIVELLKYIMV